MIPTEGKGKLKELYSSLVKDGYELPADYSVFEKDMSDDNNLNSLYDNLVKDGYELPSDREVFRADMFGEVKKKDQPAESQSAEVSSENSTPVAEKDLPVSQEPSAASGADNAETYEVSVKPEPHKQFIQNQIATGTKTAEEAQRDWEQANPELNFLSNRNNATAPLPEGFVKRPKDGAKLLDELQVPGSSGLVEDKENTKPLPTGADYWAKDGRPIRIKPDGSIEDARISHNPFVNFVRGADNALMGLLGAASSTIGLGASVAADAVGTEVLGLPALPEAAKSLRRLTTITNKIAENINKGVASQPVFSSTEQVNDFQDAANYVASTIGQTGAQMGAHILTGGSTAFIQETGSAYAESIEKIAKEKGITAEQVIEWNLDAPYLALAVGAINGRLENLQPQAVKKMMETTGSPKAWRQVLLDAGKGFTKGSVIEGATEGAQGATQQFVTNLSKQDDFAVHKIQKAIAEIDTEAIKQETIAGAVGGGFMQGGGALIKGGLNAVTGSKSETDKSAERSALENQLVRAQQVAATSSNPQADLNVAKIKEKLNALDNPAKPTMNDIPEIIEANEYHQDVLADPTRADFEKEAARKALADPVAYLEGLRDNLQELDAEANAEEVARLTTAIDNAKVIQELQPVTPEKAIENALETVETAAPEEAVASVLQEAENIREAVKAATEGDVFEVGETVEFDTTPKTVAGKSLDEMLAESESAKPESVDEDLSDKFPVGDFAIRKINPNGANTELTERQQGSLEKAVEMAIQAGQTAEQVLATLNGLGFAFTHPDSAGNATVLTIKNYIQDRIDGKESRGFIEFSKDTRGNKTESAAENATILKEETTNPKTVSKPEENSTQKTVNSELDEKISSIEKRRKEELGSVEDKVPEVFGTKPFPTEKWANHSEHEVLPIGLQWVNKEHDLPIKVVGYGGKENGATLYNIEYVSSRGKNVINNESASHILNLWEDRKPDSVVYPDEYKPAKYRDANKIEIEKKRINAKFDAELENLKKIFEEKTAEPETVSPEPEKVKTDNPELRVQNNLASRVTAVNQGLSQKNKDGSPSLKAQEAAKSELGKLIVDAGNAGYEVVQKENGSYQLQKEGKRVQYQGEITNTSEVENFVPLESRTPEVQEVANKLIAHANDDPKNLMGLGLGIKQSEVKGLLNDIATGRNTERANRLLELAENAVKNGGIDVTEGSGITMRRSFVPLADVLAAETNGTTEVASVVTDDELQDLITNNPNVRSIAEDFTNEDNSLDLVKLAEELNTNEGAFVGQYSFPYSLTEEEFNNLKAIVNERASEKTDNAAENESVAGVRATDTRSEETNKGTTESKREEIQAKRQSIKDRIKEKTLSRANALPVDLIADYVELGATYIEEGILDLKEFAARLRADHKEMFGDEVELADSEIQQIYTESGGVIEPPVAKSVTSEPVSGQKERETTRKVIADPSKPDALKMAIPDETIYYEPTTNKSDDAAAKGIIEQNGLDKALEIATDKDSQIPGSVRTALLINLENDFLKQWREAFAKGQTEIAESALRKSEQALSARALTNTEIAQQLQANVLAGTSPAAVVGSTKQAVQKEQDKKLKKDKPKLAQRTKDLNNANKESADETLNTERVKKAINKVKGTGTNQSEPKAKTSYGSKNKLVSTEKYLATLAELRGRAFSGIDPKFAVIGVYHIEAGARSFSDFSRRMLRDLGNGIKAHLPAIYNASKEQLIAEGTVSAADFDTVSDDVSMDKFAKDALRKELKNAGNPDAKPKPEADPNDERIDIEEVVKQHFSVADAAKTSLSEKLVQQSGLTGALADKLAQIVQEEFDRIATAKKKKLLERSLTVKERVKPKKAKQLHEKIIELSNLGALTDEEMTRLYAEKMDLPHLTPEQTAKIYDLAEKVQLAPEGMPKHKAIKELLDYQGTLSLSFWDITNSIWYGHLLSGPLTHMINITSTGFNTASELLVSSAQNPMNIPNLLKGSIKGAGHGVLEAWNTLKTGETPIRHGKFEGGNPLEVMAAKYGNKDPRVILTALARYSFRSLAAADVFFYQINRGMRIEQLAAKEAKATGQTSSDVLGKTEERLAEAKLQAQDEGYTGTEYARRVNELMDQSIPEEIREDASMFASAATFNKEPDGFLGFYSNKVAELVGSTHGAKLIVPFTRVVSNVAQTTLDYSLYGFIPAIMGRRGLLLKDAPITEKYRTELTTEQRVRQLIKATAGTAAMAAVYALAQPGDDGEEPILEITANGTGDYKKNQQLAKEGWQAYSVKFNGKWYSYQTSPALAIPFMSIGAIMDDRKYNGAGNEDEGWLAKTGLYTLSTVQFFTNMTFLKGISEFLDNVSRGEKSDPTKYAGRLATGLVKPYVYPALFQQVSREISMVQQIPMKEAKTWYEQMIKDVPYAQNGLKNAIDALGDPVIVDTDRLISDKPVFRDEVTEKAWEVILKNQAWISKPDPKKTKVYDRATKSNRLMTDEEFYEYAQKRGEYIKAAISGNSKNLEKMEPAMVKKYISSYTSYATQMAKMAISGKK